MSWIGAKAAADELAKLKDKDNPEKEKPKNPTTDKESAGDSDPGPGEGKKLKPEDAIDVDANKAVNDGNTLPLTEAKPDLGEQCPLPSDDGFGPGDKYQDLLPEIEEAAEKGGQQGAKVGAMAALKAYRLNSGNKRQLNNTFMTNNYDGYQSNDDNKPSKSTADVNKIAREGAIIGAVEGAVSAATTTVTELGGSDTDKQKAAITAKGIGHKIIRDEKFISTVVNEAISEVSQGNGSSSGDASSSGGGAMDQPTTEQNFGSTASSDEFAEMGLKAHNMFRKIHGTPDLKLDDEMNKDAQEYAKVLAKLGRLEHASQDARKGNGENLAFACTSEKSEMKAEQAVHNWWVKHLIHYLNLTHKKCSDDLQYIIRAFYVYFRYTSSNKSPHKNKVFY